MKKSEVDKFYRTRPLPRWFCQTGEEALRALSAIAIGPRADDTDYVRETANNCDGVTRFYAIKEMCERIYGKVKAVQASINEADITSKTLDELKEDAIKLAYANAATAIVEGNDKVIIATLKAVDERYRGTDDLDKGNDEYVDGFQLAIIDPDDVELPQGN